MKEKYNILFTKDGKINSNLLSNEGERIKKLNLDIYNEIISHPVGKTTGEKIYCLVNGIYTQPTCLACGKPTNFFGASKGGYAKHCSKKCISKSKETKEKKSINHPFTREEFKEKQKIRNKKIYGVEYYQQTLEYKEKCKSTIQEKYNTTGVISVPEYKEKFIKTLRTNNYESFKEKLLVNKNLILLSSKEEYINSNKYKVKCEKCGSTYKTSSTSFKEVLCCHNCYISKFHLSVKKYIESLSIKNILINDRKTISPLELDIYIPELKIAIECDGVYYHSEVSGNKDKNYHLNKTKLCEEQGIRLIHIFENEWINKKEIVCDILKRTFNKIENKIYARKCTIKELHAKDVKDFINNNHLQGFKGSSKYVGLYYNNELVSCISLSYKNDIWELDRFCQKVDISVYYSLSKLLTYSKKMYNIHKLYTFCDKRYFNGQGYIKSGFKIVTITPSNYFYFSYDVPYNLKSRIQFQKHKLKAKLEVYDENLSEWNNMKNNGYDRIWDCGNIKLVLDTL